MHKNRETSRRIFLKAGLSTLAASTMAGGASAQSGPDSKVEQSVVQYQNTPKDGAKCSLCINFVPPNACKVVQGTISPDGWCVAYAPKGS